MNNYRLILSRAWPIILANSTAPLLGLVDTAVIGRTGSTYDLGAIALGSLIFSFIYWSFGFLRMGTSGFTAQADGADDEDEVRAVMVRAGLLGLVLGAVLVLLQWPLMELAMALFGASQLVEQQTQVYFHIRIWSAPAALCLFALMGWLIGLGQSKTLLQLQLLLNLMNIGLDILFAGFLGWGIQGIALGTLLAEYLALFYAALLVTRHLRSRHTTTPALFHWHQILDWQKIKLTLNANFNIMVRTLLLLFSFAWFTDQGARFGDAVLAANHILLQFISFSAFFLDGFAFVTESMIGKAKGKGDRQAFLQAIRDTNRLAAVTALLLAGAFFLAGDLLTLLITDIESVRSLSGDYLWLACIYILVSFAAFQMDGIFIGTSKTLEMRNASIATSGFFIFMCIVLTDYWQNTGLWTAFILFVIARALALYYYFRRDEKLAT